MSQKRLTDYYSDCKRVGTESRAKRRKIMLESLTSEASFSNKRQTGRRNKIIPVNRSDDFETPQKGFHFDAYISDASGGVNTPATATVSAKKRLILKGSPKRSKQIDKTVFAFVGNSGTKSGESVNSSSLNKMGNLDGGASASLDSEKMSTVTSELYTGPTVDMKSGNSQTVDTTTQDVVTVPSGYDKDKKLVLKTQESDKTQVKGLQSTKLQAESSALKKPLKLSAADIKAKLNNCSGLDELKKRLKDFDKKKAIVESKALVKISPSAKTSESVVEEEKQANFSDATEPVQKATADSVTGTGQAAYEKYHSLAVPVPPTLTLPLSYQVLRDLFTSADTTVSMLDKRSEVCTFQKLTDAVQSMTKRAFGLKHLGQIKTVYPTAYHFRQERNLHKSGARTAEYQLTIQANLDERSQRESGTLDKNDRKSSVEVQKVPLESKCNVSRATKGVVKQGGTKIEEFENNEGRSSFTLNKLIERRTTFFTNLINLVKGYHKEFLERLGVGEIVSHDKILRWHPKFNVDSVPEIQPADLPKPPEESRLLRTASDVLEQASKSKHQLNPILQRALERVSAAKASANITTASVNQSSPSSTLVNPNNPLSKSINQNSYPSTVQSSLAVKGIPQSLLEKVRAKEALMQECAMMRSEEKEKRLVMLDRLPEIMRILRGEFVMKKKPALPMRECCQKIIDSYRSRLNPEDCEAHLRLIAEVAPEFLSVVKISSGFYIKLDANVSLTVISDKVAKMRKDSLIK